MRVYRSGCEDVVEILHLSLSERLPYSQCAACPSSALSSWLSRHVQLPSLLSR